MTTIGSQHPQPENIPHLNTNTLSATASNGGGGNGNALEKIPSNQAGSPVKESSFLHRETSASDDAEVTPEDTQEAYTSPTQRTSRETMPMRFQA